MSLAVAGLITTHLHKVMAEVHKTRARADADKALAIAEGQLEYAKNVVNGAPYAAGVNTALAAAATSNPPYVPGTSVTATRIGPSDSDWFLLRASGVFGRARKHVQATVKQRSPISAYNFFVIDHPIGISGAPRGAIHSNKTVDFYFPWGLYRDEVTACNGFQYQAGASTSNTRLLGMWDAGAASQDILAGQDVARLKDKATTLAVTDDLIAEVQFAGKTAEVKLFKPETTIEVARIGSRSVFDHYADVSYQEEVKHYTDVSYPYTYDVYENVVSYEPASRNVYDYVDVDKTRVVDVYEDVVENYTRQVPIYEMRSVTSTVREQVWVETPPPPLEDIEGGFAVGGSAPELGHWEWVDRTVTTTQQVLVGHRDEPATRLVRQKTGTRTETYTERVAVFSHTETYQKETITKVKTGTATEMRTRQEYSHSTYVQKTRQEPVYRQEEYTYFETVVVPEEHVDTKTVDVAGLIYIENKIRRVSGTINGKVSLCSNHSVTIDGSLVYVDDAGQTRMLHGTDPSQKYEFNPRYNGSSVLGIMSKGDIIYSKEGPTHLEINAALISMQGKVAYEGVQLNGDGTEVSVELASLGDKAKKASIRRLGGIVARHRPVTSYVDASNTVIAGYDKGISFMDRNMILKDGGNVVPPFMFHIDRPLWSMHSAGRLYMPR